MTFKDIVWNWFAGVPYWIWTILLTSVSSYFFFKLGLKSRNKERKQDNITRFVSRSEGSSPDSIWLCLFTELNNAYFLKYDVYYYNKKLITIDQPPEKHLVKVSDTTPLFVQVSRMFLPPELDKVKCKIVLYFMDMIGIYYKQELIWNIYDGAVPKDPIEISKSKYKRSFK